MPKPTSSLIQVSLSNPIEGGLKIVEKSDWPIVLGDGKADHMGKGSAVVRSLQRKHKPGMKDWTTYENHIAGNSEQSVIQKDVCEASTTEEPGAVVPHAGICEGAVGQLAVLP